MYAFPNAGLGVLFVAFLLVSLALLVVLPPILFVARFVQTRRWLAQMTPSARNTNRELRSMSYRENAYSAPEQLPATGTSHRRPTRLKRLKARRSRAQLGDFCINR